LKVSITYTITAGDVYRREGQRGYARPDHLVDHHIIPSPSTKYQVLPIFL
jgi:hypothetical protein